VAPQAVGHAKLLARPAIRPNLFSGHDTDAIAAQNPSMSKLPSSLLLPPLLLAIAWGQELIDQLAFGGQWNLAMLPGGSILGVLTAPFSHGGFGHLISNSLWFLPLSWLVLAKGRGDYLAVWIGVYATAIPVWLFWPVGSHGLSGVIYGLLGYLLVIGWLEKRPLSLLLSLGCLFLYGGMLPALLPLLSPAGVSWIGHASGFVGGVLAALAIHREPTPA
jgi:membrane associated rhomboid family serine protease